MNEILIQKITTKISRLPETVQVFNPQDLPPQIQADWLISLLSRMYVSHGITKNPDKLISDIQSGVCRCWFATESDQPIAAAALVDQDDGSIELGRAVSFKDGVGGLLMLLAANSHLTASSQPLVAEVRASDNFQGISSGEATQHICLNLIGLIPNAIVPAFHHAGRQEQFLFSSTETLSASEPAILPVNQQARDFISSTALKLAQGKFHPTLKSDSSPSSLPNSGWEIVMSDPFALVLPSSNSSNLESTITKTESLAPFTLIPLPATASNIGLVNECLDQGFVPCGIDRNLDSTGHPIIFFGRLKQGTLLAPIKLINNSFTPDQLSAINTIDMTLRK